MDSAEELRERFFFDDDKCENYLILEFSRLASVRLEQAPIRQGGDGGTEPILEIPRYDAHWQGDYLENPRDLTWAEDQEMCLAFITARF